MAGLREKKKGIRRPCFLALAISISISIPRERASERAKRLGLAEFQDRGASAKSESARHESARGETDRSDPLGGYREPARRSTKVPPKSRLRSTTMERYRMSSIRRLSFSFYPLFTFADEQVLFFFYGPCKTQQRLFSIVGSLRFDLFSSSSSSSFRSIFPPLLAKLNLQAFFFSFLFF